MEEDMFVLVRDLMTVLNEARWKSPSVDTLNLCVYLVSLRVLQSSKKLSTIVADPRLAEDMVDKCARDLQQDPVYVKTLTLQAFWREKYRPKEDVRKIHHETISKNVLPIMTEVIEESLVKSVDKERLYRKIVIFIIMFAGLGSPTEASILRETQAALFSIFKNSEMDNFLTLSKPTKEQQLVEFARLITGIRLFNKDCKKGGDGIDDLPLILTQGVKATKDRVLQFKNQVDRRIDHLVRVLGQVYGTKGDDDEVHPRLPPDFTADDLDELKDWLTHFRQMELCLKNLIKDLDESRLTIDDLIGKLQSTLIQVHEVVRFRVAVATIQVFPLFLQLSNVWIQMQEEVDILSEANNIFAELTSTFKGGKPTPLELALDSTLADSSRPYHPDLTDIINPTSDFRPGVTVCSYSKVYEEEEDAELQYGGFCAWTLSQTNGVLVPGNVTIGLLQYQTRYYSFVNSEAACKWAGDPEGCLKKVLAVAKRKVDTVKLLGLFEDLEAEEKDELAYEREQRATCHAEVQTELHPVESHIVREYTHSEWELKKRALKLAALTRCVTKSQQTVIGTRFKPEVAVQATPVADRDTQTSGSMTRSVPLDDDELTMRQLCGSVAELTTRELGHSDDR